MEKILKAGDKIRLKGAVIFDNVVLASGSLKFLLREK